MAFNRTCERNCNFSNRVKTFSSFCHILMMGRKSSYFTFFFLVCVFSSNVYSEAKNHSQNFKETYVIRYFEGQKIIPVSVELDTQEQTEHVVSMSSKNEWNTVTFYDFLEKKVAYKDADSRQCFVGELGGETLEMDRERLTQLNSGIVKGFYIPTFIILREVTDPYDIRTEFGSRISTFCNGTAVLYVTEEILKPNRRKKRNTLHSGTPDRNGQFTHHSYGHYGHQNNNYAHYGHDTRVTGTVDKDGNIGNQRFSQHQVKSEGSQAYPYNGPGNGFQSQTIRQRSSSGGLTQPDVSPTLQRNGGNNLLRKDFDTSGNGQFSLQTNQESGYQLNLPFGLTAGNAYRSGIRSLGHYGGGQPQIHTDYQQYPGGQRADGFRTSTTQTGGYGTGVPQPGSHPPLSTSTIAQRPGDSFVQPGLSQTGYPKADDFGRIPSGIVTDKEQGISTQFPDTSGIQHSGYRGTLPLTHSTRGIQTDGSVLSPSNHRIQPASEIYRQPTSYNGYPSISPVSATHTGLTPLGYPAISPGSGTQNRLTPFGYPSMVPGSVTQTGITPLGYPASGIQTEDQTSIRQPQAQILPPGYVDSQIVGQRQPPPMGETIAYPRIPPSEHGYISPRPEFLHPAHPAVQVSSRPGETQTDQSHIAREFPRGVPARGTPPVFGDTSKIDHPPTSEIYNNGYRDIRGSLDGIQVPQRPSPSYDASRSISGEHLPIVSRESPVYPISTHGVQPTGYQTSGESTRVRQGSIPGTPGALISADDQQTLTGASLLQPRSSIRTGTGGPVSSRGQPAGVILPNGDAASSQTQIQTGLGGTAAEASAAGQYKGRGSQTQVQGGYSGNGSFSAQAQSGFTGGLTQSQVQGGKQGGVSGSSAIVERVGSAQSQVQIGRPSGAASSSAQGRFSRGMTQVQAQSGRSGGSAGAESQSSGLSNSQVQVNIAGEGSSSQNAFQGTVSASVQGGQSSGQSQTQLQGGYNSGRTYVATAQGGFDSNLGFQGSVPSGGTDQYTGLETRNVPEYPSQISTTDNTRFGRAGRTTYPSTMTGVTGRDVASPVGNGQLLRPADSLGNLTVRSPSDRGSISQSRLPDSQQVFYPPLTSMPSGTRLNSGFYPTRIQPGGLSPAERPVLRGLTDEHYPSRSIPEQIPGSHQPSAVRGFQPSSHQTGIDQSLISGIHQTGLQPPVALRPGPIHTQYQPDSQLYSVRQQEYPPHLTQMPSQIPTQHLGYRSDVGMQPTLKTGSMTPEIRPDLTQHSFRLPTQTRDQHVVSEHHPLLPSQFQPGYQPGYIQSSDQMPSHLTVGQIPRQLPEDQLASQLPTGQFPTHFPSSQLPGHFPSGQMPSLFPSSELPSHFPSIQLPSPQFPLPSTQFQIPSGTHINPQTGSQMPGYPTGPIIQPSSQVSTGVPSSVPGQGELVPPRFDTSISPDRSQTGRDLSPPSIMTTDHSSVRPTQRPGVAEPDLTDEGRCCEALKNLKDRCCGRNNMQNRKTDSSCCSKTSNVDNDFDLDEDFGSSRNGEPCKVVKAICYIVYKPVGKARICKPTHTNGC